MKYVKCKPFSLYNIIPFKSFNSFPSHDPHAHWLLNIFNYFCRSFLNHYHRLFVHKTFWMGIAHWTNLTQLKASNQAYFTMLGFLDFFESTIVSTWTVHYTWNFSDDLYQKIYSPLHVSIRSKLPKYQKIISFVQCTHETVILVWILSWWTRHT